MPNPSLNDDPSVIDTFANTLKNFRESTNTGVIDRIGAGALAAPALPFNLYALGAKGVEALTGGHVAGSDTAANIGQTIDHGARTFAGVGEPQNLGDTLAETMGGVASGGFGSLAHAIPNLLVGTTIGDLLQDYVNPEYKGAVSTVTGIVSPEAKAAPPDISITTPIAEITPKVPDISLTSAVPDISLTSNAPDLSVDPVEAQQRDSHMLWWKLAAGAAVLVGGAAVTRAAINASERAAVARASKFTGEPAAAVATPVGEAKGLGNVIPDPVREAAEPLSLQLSRDWQNKTAHAEATAKGIGDEGLANRVSNAYSEGYLRTRTNYVGKTGELPNGTTKPALADVANDFASLEPEKLALARDALNAATELDNRARNYKSFMADIQAGKRPGPTVSDYETRVNLRDSESSELRGSVLKAENDPTVKAAMDQYRVSMDSLVNYAEKQGLFTRDELFKMQSQNPNYVPTIDLNGRVVPDQARKIDPGVGKDMMPDPVLALEQYEAAILRMDMQNQARRDLVEGTLAWQKSGKSTQELMTPRDAPIEGRTWGYKDQSGNQKYVEINNPMLYASLKAGSDGTSSVVANMSRRLFQSSITGTLGAVAGFAFHPSAAIHDTILGSINRKPGTSMGLIDAALQKAGFKYGLPGDLTSFAGSGYAVMADISSYMAHNISNIMNESITKGGYIADILGPKLTQNIADGMANRWNTSVLRDMEKQGAANSAVTAFQDFSGAQTMMSGIAPDYMRTLPKGSGIKSYINEIKQIPGVVKVANAIDAVLEIVGNSARSNYFRMNRGKVGEALTMDDLVYETRRLSGDFSKVGGGKYGEAFAKAMPYWNVGIQGTSRTLETAIQRPVTFAAGVASSVGMLALYEALSALAHGDDAVKHLVQEQSTTDVGGKARIYIPGAPPEASWYIGLPPEMRGPKAAISYGLANVLGLFDKTYLHPDNVQTIDAWHEMLDNRLHESVMEGLASTITPETPPLLSAALAGVSLVSGQPPVKVDLKLGQTGYSGTQNRTKGWAEDEMESNRMKAVSNLFEGLMGTVGHAVLESTKAYHYTVDGKKLDAASDAYGLLVRDRYPFANGLLWQHEARLPQSTPDNDLLFNKKQKIEEISKTLSAASTPQPTNKLGMQHGDYAPGNVDPSVLPIVESVHAFYGQLKSGYLDQITAMRNNLQGIDKSAFLMPTDKRSARNQDVREYDRLVRAAVGDIKDFEMYMSHQLGKTFSVSKFDPTKGMDQFRD